MRGDEMPRVVLLAARSIVESNVLPVTATAIGNYAWFRWFRYNRGFLFCIYAILKHFNGFMNVAATMLKLFLLYSIIQALQTNM